VPKPGTSRRVERRSSAAKPRPARNVSQETGGEDCAIRSHRERQASIAQIIDNTFGQAADANPKLWKRRVYWTLISLVYDRLIGREPGIPTDELASLAKILAEHRRAAHPARHARRTAKTDRKRLASSPESFADLVCEVYGTQMGGVGG